MAGGFKQQSPQSKMIFKIDAHKSKKNKIQSKMIKLTN